MNVRGYLRWKFAGSLTSPTFYGLILLVLGLAAYATGCPNPWPLVLIWSGAALNVIDAIWSWLRFSYSVYEMEQRQIVRNLEQKDR